MILVFREHRGDFIGSLKTARKYADTTELYDKEGVGELVFYARDERLKSECFLALKDGAPFGYVTEDNGEIERILSEVSPHD